ncbi:hypothetical protein DFH94DRAFT_682395 [Russula ochroleuca]|uniref:Uncharacterized protein n=1 Tax=Russula ochroleuca TaxID=152965 RepID=A0A9P5MVF4_9AGAM|nr:hypothetical protein DFH94DRAFT_682395 [Russula ochroleuca]
MDARRGRGCRGPVQGESKDESEAISEGMPARVPITYLTSSPRHRQRRGRRRPARHANTGTVMNVNTITRGVVNVNKARWGLRRGASRERKHGAGEREAVVYASKGAREGREESTPPRM